MRKALVLFPALGAVVLFAVEAPTPVRTGAVITPALVEGDPVAGVGNVTSIVNLAVNNSGTWAVEADTDNPDTETDSVLVLNDMLLHREGEAVIEPPGASIDSFDSVRLNSNGDGGFNHFLEGPPTNADSGVYFKEVLVIQESDISTAPQFTPGTPYIGFFDVKINDANQLMIVASIDDPAIATTVDRALVIALHDGEGNLVSETVLAKEGDILPGQTQAVADFSTGPQTSAFSSLGQVLYLADLTGATATDGALYRDLVLLGQEGSPSPVAGRNYELLLGRGLDLSAGHWVVKANLDGATTDDEVIIRDGTLFRQEGQSLPAIAPFLFTAFGTTSGPVEVDDDGNVLWYGDWDDPNTDVDTGLFLNDQLLVQEGVTTIDGVIVDAIANGEDAFQLSPNGDWALFEATLANGLDGAFLIELPVSGGCTPGSCNDDNPCTDDECNTSTGECVFTPDDTNTCDDADQCTAEACMAGECISTPVSCDDGNPCTDDECNTSTGCEFTPDDTNTCDDADQCTTEACMAGECNTTPVNCDDMDPCTIDSCDPDTGCVHEPNLTAPVIVTQPSLSPDGGCVYLWPPQHGYVDFGIADTGIEATDPTGEVTFAFSSCHSSQPENASGDGNSERDCVYEPSALHLRAERAGSCAPIGRSYTTTITVTNVCGVSATSDPFGACVLHSRSQEPEGATVFSPNPGSNQNDTRPGINGTYGEDCGTGCGAVCDPEGAAADPANLDWDRDGVPVGEDNCPDFYNPAQGNTDASEEGVACDANDGLVDHSWFATPVEIAWTAEGGSVQYNVYRGSFPSAGFANATCFGVVVALRALDGDQPAPGQGLFYVITTVIEGNEGSPGQASDGTTRTLSDTCP